MFKWLDSSTTPPLTCCWLAVGLMLGYNIFLFLLYAMIPVLVRQSSATLVNLSFLTSDVYSVLFGIFLFHAQMSWLYILGFIIILVGLFGYTRAESQAETGTLFNVTATTAERQRLTSTSSDDGGSQA
eukprot:m.47125 g.47125  ORF g.47125 m.47125 type:complete len:128 (+) comp13203_c0_seq4:915-1298(+)